MARRNESVDGSLDLLLDTITNTFGSVLFITMLIAILLRTSGLSEGEQAPTSKTDQARTEARITELSAEVQNLRAKLDALPPADPVLASMENEIANATQDIVRVLVEDAAVAARTVIDQERAAELSQLAADTKDQLERLTPFAEQQASRRKEAEAQFAELANVALELDQPVDPTRITQTARLPELAATKKEQFGIYMRHGRVYVMHSRGPNEERLGPNPDDFLITVRADGRQTAQARPDAGHIADGVTLKKTLQDILRRYPADAWVVVVVVHEDSFAQFQTVKASLVDLGYQYEPIIVRPNGGVWDSGGSGKRGQ